MPGTNMISMKKAHEAVTRLMNEEAHERVEKAAEKTELTRRANEVTQQQVMKDGMVYDVPGGLVTTSTRSNTAPGFSNRTDLMSMSSDILRRQQQLQNISRPLANSAQEEYAHRLVELEPQNRREREMREMREMMKLRYGPAQITKAIDPHNPTSKRNKNKKSKKKNRAKNMWRGW